MASVFQRLLQIQFAFQEELLRKNNVVGVAIGYKESGGVRTTQPAVIVLVEQKKPNAGLNEEDKIPAQINGIPTDVFESGPIHALSSINPRGRFRPIIPGGVSIGHYKVTAGTFGTVVFDRKTGEKFILSNNHVLANSNEALIGDVILQPAATDGGQNPADVVARLERFIALNYIEGAVDPPGPTQPTPGGGGTTPTPSGCDITDILVSISNLLAGLAGSEKRVEATKTTGASGSAQATSTPPVSTMTATASAANVKENTVDCALVRPNDANMFSQEISGIGVVSGTKPPAIGMRVRKFGRTTGYTEGNITLLNATVNVGYSTSKGPRTARFVGQVITEAMSQGGDSGSLIVDKTENKAVGLLFAGSNAATIFTPINAVLEALKITI